MALKACTREDLQRIEEKLMDVAHEVRKLRQEWELTGFAVLDLEIEKAETFADYLKDTWVGRLYGQYRVSKARKTAEAKQSQVSNKEK